MSSAGSVASWAASRILKEDNSLAVVNVLYLQADKCIDYISTIYHDHRH